MRASTTRQSPPEGARRGMKDRKAQEQETHHFLERQRFISHSVSVSAAEIPEYGISHHQLKPGRANPDNQLYQNIWR